MIKKNHYLNLKKIPANNYYQVKTDCFRRKVWLFRESLGQAARVLLQANMAESEIIKKLSQFNKTLRNILITSITSLNYVTRDLQIKYEIQ